MEEQKGEPAKEEREGTLGGAVADGVLDAWARSGTRCCIEVKSAYLGVMTLVTRKKAALGNCRPWSCSSGLRK